MMHPELSLQFSLDRMARFESDARRYRRAREASKHAPRTVRTQIQLRLSACREELERLAPRRGAAGRSTE